MKTQRLIDRIRGGRQGRLWLAAAVSVVILGVVAVSAKPGHADTLISQGFLTTTALPTGTIVALEKDTSDIVTSATVATANNILGVVIGTNSSQVSVESGQGNQVQVATSGIEQVLVSDISGNITVGDAITSSPIAGVGMEAIGNSKVVGIAQDDFPNSTASQQTYTGPDKQQHTVKVGTVPVLVNVAYYYKTPDKTLVPPAVQNIANALAGKTVDPLPVLISVGIFFVTLLIVVSIIYSLIHSSIISVGRNPMSQAAVYRNVIQLSALVIIILGVATIAIYLTLTRL